MVDSHQLTFTRPAGLQAGGAYVQAINPPFIPYTSSGSGAGGALALALTVDAGQEGHSSACPAIRT